MKITHVLLAAALLATPAAADEPADGIQSTISDQNAAFQRDDLAHAFAHASPKIQGIFQNPQTFGEMVREGYPMVWRPSRWEMRELIETGAGPVQVVLYEDRFGRLYEAGYLMTEVDSVWRIDGVQIRQLPGAGT